jgi:rare lipoprotein A
VSPSAGTTGARGSLLAVLALVLAGVGGTAYASQADDTQNSPLAASATRDHRADSFAITLAMSPQRVAFGKKVIVRGRARNAELVVVALAPNGRARFRPLAVLRPAPSGEFSLRWRARHSGVVRAVALAGGSVRATSRPLAVAVLPRVSARVLSRHLRIGGGLAAALRARSSTALVVRLQIRRAGRWRTLARRRVASGGRLRLRARLAHAGIWRARIAVEALYPGRRYRVIRSLGRIFVYRPASASWYGPGLYGGALACGGRLYPATVGVAHRWLPCGTRVAFRYGRRTVIARVVDRGPFVAGREWDLTAALKYRLGFGSTGTVWVAH